MSKKPSEELIALDIMRVSHETGVPLSQLTYAQYKKLGHHTYAELQKCGGFQAILKHYFQYLDTPEMRLVHAKRVKARYIRRLEARVASQEYLMDQLVDAVHRGLRKYPLKVKKYNQPKRLPRDSTRAITALLSDTHFGLDISARETGTNEYNWLVASRRMSHYIESIVEHARVTTTKQLHLCIGGDIAQGIVYTVDKGTHPIVTQVLGSAHIIVNMLEYALHYFDDIYVHCTPDNHMRLPSKKRDGLISQKWDSFSTMLHIILATHFRNHTRVKFNVPLTPYTVVKVFDHTFFLTHGDTVLNIPFPSKVLPVERITLEKNRLIGSGIVDSLDAILIGHLHTPLCMPLDAGGTLIVNGTGSGNDNYSVANGYLYNNPTQIFFTSTTQEAVDSVHPVRLAIADGDPRYDQIIQPFRADILGPDSLIMP